MKVHAVMFDQTNEIAVGYDVNGWINEARHFAIITERFRNIVSDIR
jgi:hypothetical protein